MMNKLPENKRQYVPRWNGNTKRTRVTEVKKQPEKDVNRRNFFPPGKESISVMSSKMNTKNRLVSVMEKRCSNV